MRRFLALGMLACLLCVTHGAAVARNDPLVPSRTLDACGTANAAPFAYADGAVLEDRPCPAPVARSYVPRHHTLAHEILTEESEACFVPDDAFQLLDAVIDQSVEAVRARATATGSWEARATATFKAIGSTLVANGFHLYIPTKTLGNALVQRPLAGGGRHIIDCDTGSFLYMAVAEKLSLPVHFVEIKLGVDTGHNYVRWTTDLGDFMDWDTNGRAQCLTPPGLPSWQGKTLSRRQTLGYAASLRAILWKKQNKIQEALSDYTRSMTMYPSSPASYNNMAWLVATKGVLVDPALFADARIAAERAISIERSANYLDTLACVQARMGDFAAAAVTQAEAVSKAPGEQAFDDRLKGFQAQPPKDCVGAD